MSHCPACLLEYEESAAGCGDCGGALSPGPAPRAASSMGGAAEWTCLARFRSEEGARIVCGLLQDAGIEAQLLGKGAAEMPVPAVASFSRFEVWVPAGLEAEGRAVLDAAREGTVPCPSCGHMSAPEEARCEYCGAAVG